MYLDAKETARLYKLLSDQLGSDTTEAMFKYIDNKTERSVEATIKTLATKDDIANLRKETASDIGNLRKEIGDDILKLRLESKDDISNLRKELSDDILKSRLESKEEISSLRNEMKDSFENLYKYLGDNSAGIQKQMGENRSETIKWMFLFWVGNFAAMLGIVLLILKK